MTPCLQHDSHIDEKHQQLEEEEEKARNPLFGIGKQGLLKVES